jgi:hypothetical protein
LPGKLCLIGVILKHKVHLMRHTAAVLSNLQLVKLEDLEPGDADSDFRPGTEAKGGDRESITPSCQRSVKLAGIFFTRFLFDVS